MKREINPINERIARYRKLAGYTQQTAAEALGVKKNTYARMELHGNPTPDMLKKLAALYNVSSELILYGADGGKTETANTGIVIPVIEQQRRLSDNPPSFAREPDLVLTTNERNCIKACRNLSKDDRDKIMAFINELYKNSNG